MDYEKAYKEAFERAKQVHASSVDENKKSAEYIFPQLKESEDERIRKELIDAVQGLWNDDALPMPLSVKRKNEWLAWLEKQGDKSQGKSAPEAINEKPSDNANNVVTKFKVGDWIVKKDGKNFSNGSNFARITKIDKEKYWFDSGTYLRAEDIRLWTIQDAKDGDVLAFDNGDVLTFNKDNIFIFKELYSSTKFYSYSLVIDGMFLCVNSEWFYPATKEQRDLFFKNLKEAGIEWDSENKKVQTIMRIRKYE